MNDFLTEHGLVISICLLLGLWGLVVIAALWDD